MNKCESHFFLITPYYNAFILDIDLAFYTLIKNCTKNSELHIFIFYLKVSAPFNVQTINQHNQNV